MKSALAWFSNWFHEHRKAFAAAGIAAVGLLLKDSDLFRHMPSTDEWWQMVALFVAAAGLTGVLPNRNYVKVNNAK